MKVPVTVLEIDGGSRARVDEGKRGLFCTEIMIYSEEIRPSPVCNAELHAVRNDLPTPKP